MKSEDRFFRRRPLCVAGLCTVLSALLAFFSAGTAKWISASVMFVAAAVNFAILKLRCRRQTFLRTLPLFLCIGGVILALLSSYLWFDVTVDGTVRAYTQTACRVEATVLERRSSANYGASFDVWVTDVNGNDVGFRAYLTIDGYADLQAGNVIAFDTVPIGLADTADDGQTLAAAMARGCVLCLPVDDTVCPNGIGVIGTRYELPQLWLREVRDTMSVRLSESIGGEEGNIAAAILLGDRSRLDDETERDFRRIGISHLLALSGLHLAVLCLALEWLLRALRMPKTARVAVIAVLIVLYTALTGFSPSICRAAAMTLLLYLGFLYSASYDAPTALSAVAGGMLILCPMAVTSVSFWLSVCAVFGILTFSPLEKPRAVGREERKKHPIRCRCLRVGRAAVATLAVGFSANAAVALVTAVCFRDYAYLSLLTTVLFAPAVSLALWLSLALGLVGYIPFVGAFLSDVLRVWLNAIRWLAFWISTESPIPVTLPSDIPWAAWVTFAMLAALILLAALGVRRRWMLTPPAGALLLLTAFFLWSAVFGTDAVTVTYLHPTEKSDVWVFSSGSESVLVDASDGYISRFREAANTEGFRGEWNAVILTSYSTRHVSGVSAVLREERVRSLYLPYPETETDFGGLKRMAEDAWRVGTAVYVYAAGEQLPLPYGSCEIQTASLERSARTVCLLRADVCQTTLVSCPQTVAESDLACLAAEWTAKADTVLVSSSGPNMADTPAVFPLSPSAVRLLYAAGTDVAYYLPDTVPQDSADVRVDVEAYSFRIPAVP